MDPAHAGSQFEAIPGDGCVPPCSLGRYGAPPEPPAVALMAGEPLEVVDGGMPPGGIIAVEPGAGIIVLEPAGGAVGVMGVVGVVDGVAAGATGVGAVAEVAAPFSAFSSL